MAPRTTLTDAQWRIIKPFLPGKITDPGRTAVSNRRTLEGILWILRTGAPWRDVPPQFGKWNTLHRRFRRWSKTGVFDRVFAAKVGDRELRSIMVDGTFAKVHQHGAGALTSGDAPEVSAKRQNIGRSKGGLTTKVMAVIDDAGEMVKFGMSPGNLQESPLLPDLIDGVSSSELIADKAYDTNGIRVLLASKGMAATIPSKSSRIVPIWHDPERYRRRHLIENYFADLKQFRGVATRYCKLAESYKAFISLAVWLIDTRGDRRLGRLANHEGVSSIPPPANSQIPMLVSC